VGAPLTWVPSEPYSVGIEEEVMLLDPGDWAPAARADEVLPKLPRDLSHHLGSETHRAAVELATEPHATVGAAIAQLTALRERLAAALDVHGLRLAAAGVHPLAVGGDTEVSAHGRYQLIADTMRGLARREPTFALHVHVGVADPQDAIRLLNALRAHLPLLLALSANSPFWQGRDTGLASARTMLFGAFPRTGLPRAFASYEDWVATVEMLLRCGAFPEATFLWWDVRPQPRFGTVEVRVMDAQVDVARTAALCALVQAVARLEREEGFAAPALVGADELLAENRFLASRDGEDAELLDPERGCAVPVRDVLARALRAAAPHAEALGCAAELEALSAPSGCTRQRAVAARGAGLEAVVEDLSGAFVPAAGRTVASRE
jgi:glutamate---cysteine ligase / carboxylate-amine ligase